MNQVVTTNVINGTTDLTKQQTPMEVALGIDSEGKASARKLYEFLNLDSSNYSRWCQTNIESNPFAEEGKEYSVFVINEENPKGGRPSKDYKLCGDFAKKLAMACHSERGERVRDYYVQCEKLALELAKAEKKIAEEKGKQDQAQHRADIERAKGIAVRQALTDALMRTQENERMHGHAYSTYTNLIYKAVFGKDANKLREEMGLEKKDNIRDKLSTEELQQVSTLERFVSSLVDMGYGYSEVKDMVDAQRPKIAQMAGTSLVATD